MPAQLLGDIRLADGIDAPASDAPALAMLEHLAEELVDPEPHPFLAQKPVHRIQAIGEGEDEPRLGVPAGGRQIGAPLGEGHEIGVEGQHEVVVVSLPHPARAGE